jgi:hypothetical protein
MANEKIAIESVIDLFSASVIADHLAGKKLQSRINVATILALDNNGTLTDEQKNLVLALPDDY